MMYEIDNSIQLATPTSSKMAYTDTSSQGIASNPIVFAASGFKPDVRIKVFEREFHVHSIVLKLHSAFFRMLFESDDRVPPASEETFQYDYISIPDVNGGWELEIATEVFLSLPFS